MSQLALILSLSLEAARLATNLWRQAQAGTEPTQEQLDQALSALKESEDALRLEIERRKAKG